MTWTLLKTASTLLCRTAWWCQDLPFQLHFQVSQWKLTTLYQSFTATIGLFQSTWWATTLTKVIHRRPYIRTISSSLYVPQCLRQYAWTNCHHAKLWRQTLKWLMMGYIEPAPVSSCNLIFAYDTDRQTRTQTHLTIYSNFVIIFSRTNKYATSREYASQKQNQTRMHSSRMPTARSLTASRCFRGEGMCDWGVCVPGGMHTEEACMTWQGMLWYTCPVERIPDTHLWKHYLPATTAAGGKNLTQRTSLPLFLNLTDVISVLPFIKPLLFWVQYVPKIDIFTVKCD